MKSTRGCHTIVTILFVVLWVTVGHPAIGAAKGHNVVKTRAGVVAADHPLASVLGAQTLADGGNAADAVVTTLLTLGLVNPFASGLGGGGFCLYRPHDGEVSVLDFRETAPSAASRDMFIRNGKADIQLTIRGGLAVAIPGEAKGLHALQAKYGKLKWAKVVKPVRVAAQKGFAAGKLLPRRLASKEDLLKKHVPNMVKIYQKKGRWVEPGDRIYNRGLASLLLLLEESGPEAFYAGPVADAIALAVQGRGGVVTQADLAAYTPSWRQALKGTYRGYDIYAMPPPSSGGTTLIEALNLLEGYDLPTLGSNPQTTHMVVEALKHAFADRAEWLGDADFVSVPVGKLISKQYADTLRPHMIPWMTQAPEAYGTRRPPPTDAGTSHVSVIDAEGNMAACTSTVNTTFGSMVFVPKYGLILNNQMGDFTAQPGVANNYGLMGGEQNAVEPGKRPLSSMSPTLVVRDRKPVMAVGASGGPTIITGTLLTLIRLLDWRFSPRDAVEHPRVHHQWLPNKLFVEAATPAAIQVWKKRGHDVVVKPAYNSVQLIYVAPDGLRTAVSDPRKMGAPAAEKTK